MQASEDAEGVVTFEYRTQPEGPPDVQQIQKQMAIVAWQPGPNRYVQVPSQVSNCNSWIFLQSKISFYGQLPSYGIYIKAYSVNVNIASRYAKATSWDVCVVSTSKTSFSGKSSSKKITLRSDYLNSWSQWLRLEQNLQLVMQIAVLYI